MLFGVSDQRNKSTLRFRRVPEEDIYIICLCFSVTSSLLLFWLGLRKCHALSHQALSLPDVDGICSDVLLEISGFVNKVGKHPRISLKMSTLLPLTLLESVPAPCWKCTTRWFCAYKCWTIVLNSGLRLGSHLAFQLSCHHHPVLPPDMKAKLEREYVWHIHI